MAQPVGQSPYIGVLLSSFFCCIAAFRKAAFELFSELRFEPEFSWLNIAFLPTRTFRYSLLLRGPSYFR